VIAREASLTFIINPFTESKNHCCIYEPEDSAIITGKMFIYGNVSKKCFDDLFAEIMAG